MKMYLTTILLGVGIASIALGIHTNNLISIGIGGFIIGVYNAMIYYKKD